MIETLIDIGGEKLKFFQAENEEEVKSINAPSGQPYFWQDETGKRIYMPFEIIMKVTNSVQAGTFHIKNKINTKNIHQHYAGLMKAQRNNVAKHFAETKAFYREQKGLSKAMLKNIEDAMDMHNIDMMTPDIDGMVRLDKDEVEKIYGKEEAKRYAYFNLSE